MSVLPYLAGVWILLVGIYGVATSRHLVHLTICVSVAQSGTYVLLLAVGYRSGANAPVFTSIPQTAPAVDPVVQALALTDIVVSATLTAVLLALTLQADKRFGTVDPERLAPLRG